MPHMLSASVRASLSMCRENLTFRNKQYPQVLSCTGHGSPHSNTKSRWTESWGLKEDT